MKKIITNTLLCGALLAGSTAGAAELKATFGSAKVGFANWNTGFEDTGRGDLWKFMADYGAIFDTGEFYSFYEYNKFDHDLQARNYTVSANGHLRINKSDYTVFGKVYGKFENTWGDELNSMLGLGYLGVAGKSGFFKPYVAVHDLTSDYVSDVHGSANGFNGYVVGWTAAYFFNFAEQNFTLSNWNEFEIARNDAYAEQQNNDFGINGGLTLTWKPVRNISMNVTYRYFQDKLGYEGYGDQMIYMLGYHF